MQYQATYRSGGNPQTWTVSNKLKAPEVENSTMINTKNPLDKKATEQRLNKGIAAQSLEKTSQGGAESGNNAPSLPSSNKLEAPEMDKSKENILDPRFQAGSGSGDEPKERQRAPGWKR